MNETSREAAVLSRPDEGPFVPEVLHVPGSETVALRRVGILKAFLGYCVNPEKFGPYLVSRSTFLAIVLASLVSVVTVAAIALAVVVSNNSGDPIYLKSTRLVAARWMGEVIRGSGAGGVSNAALIVIAGSPLLIVLASIAWGVLTMPWALSNSRERVMRRSVNNSLWISIVLSVFVVSYAFLIPTGTGVDESGGLLIYGSLRWVDLLAHHVIPMVAMLFVIRASVQGANAVLAFDEINDTIAPRCESCGYLLVGLSVHSACPECGTLVEESFTDGRRNRLREDLASSLSGSWRERLHVVRSLMFGRSIFEVLPVHQQRLARRVWWLSMLMCWLIVEFGILATLIFSQGNRNAVLSNLTLFQLTFAMVFIMHTANLFCLVWAGRGKHGIKKARVSVSVGNFAAPMLIVPTAVVVLIGGIPTWFRSFIAGTELELTLHRMFDLTAVYIVAVLILLVVSLGWWLSCTRYGLRHARFANY